MLNRSYCALTIFISLSLTNICQAGDKNGTRVDLGRLSFPAASAKNNSNASLPNRVGTSSVVNLNGAIQPSDSSTQSEEDGPNDKDSQYRYNIGVDAPVLFGRHGLSTEYGPAVEGSAEFIDGIKLAFELRFENLMHMKDNRLVNAHKLGQWLDSATITVDLDKLTGVPVVIIVGKQDVPIGLFMPGPVEHLSFSHDTSRISGVYAVSFEIPLKQLKVLDQLKLTVFEPGQDDLKISPGYGIGFQVTKQVLSKVQVVGGFAYLKRRRENSGASGRLELPGTSVDSVNSSEGGGGGADDGNAGDSPGASASAQTRAPGRYTSESENFSIVVALKVS